MFWLFMTCFAMFCILSVRQDEMTEKELELDNKTQRGVKVGMSEEVPKWRDATVIGIS